MQLLVFLAFRALWHFDLNKYRESEKPRVKVSLAAVFAFMAIGWPAIIYFTGIAGWFKFWLMPWLGYHFWVRKISLCV
jgi:omega-6 fatty acid desaturase (delta-12 desaturase)